MCMPISFSGTREWLARLEVRPDELAEREGFEPSVRCYRTLAFQASPFDRSGTSPVLLRGVRRFGCRLRQRLGAST